MKKIINRPEDVVIEMCKGIASAHPELTLNQKYKVIKRKDLNHQKVTLISGGGSGHEPAHAGFVGKGMLDAAVCGDVFASPSQVQIYQAIKETASKKGTLLIIKNYSGDIMNFKNGAYLAKEDGIEVEYVKVEDDIAVQDSLYTVGRRGVAGTVLVHKVAGAMAEQGYGLSSVKKVAQKAADNVRSIGFAFSSCTVPIKGSPTFSIGEGEMEFGVGIHGEPGINRERLVSADELAKRTVNSLVSDLNLKDNDEIVLLINGFGSTPLQELYILNHAVVREIISKKLVINRIFVGNYMTSIDMLGASISIMKVDEELKELISYPSSASSFHVDGATTSVNYNELYNMSESNKEVSYMVETDNDFSIINENHITINNVIYIVDKMSECIIENEIPFCELDSYAGDGDFGMSIAKGFKQLKTEWKEIVKNSECIGSFLSACSIVIMEHCGGASGPIWGSAFRSAAKYSLGKKTLSLNEMSGLLQSAVTGIQKTGEHSFGRGAVVGDKTLIDALIPCSDSWEKSAKNSETMINAFKIGAEQAVSGAKFTETIIARMGRAGTVGERSLGYPDAGAFGIGVIFTDIANSLREG